jgi:hypothetical protein
MSQRINDRRIHAGAFETIAAADRAIRRLLAAGFTTDQLLVICPAKFEEHFRREVPKADVPTAGPESAIALGSAVGASLGGLALAATILTGGIAGVGVMTAAVLIGGGAIAGGFGNLVVSKGYEHEADDFYKQAIEAGRIVVGVEVSVNAGKLAEAERILNEDAAEVKTLEPV